MSTELSPAEDARTDSVALLGALRAHALRIGIVTIVLLVATFFILMFWPKTYVSSASLLIEGPSEAMATAIDMDAVIDGEIQLIQSREILLAVIDSHNLRSVPEFNGTVDGPIAALMAMLAGKPEAANLDDTVLHNLAKRLTIVREGASGVISIMVQSGDAQRAAAIANAIATSYVERTAGQVLVDPAMADAEWQRQIDEQRVRVTAADQAVADYRRANGAAATADPQADDIKRQIVEAQSRQRSVEQRAAALRELIASGQPLEGFEDVQDNPVVQSLLQSRGTLQATLAEKRVTLLPAHPTMRLLNSQIAQVDAQIANEAQRIADGLTAQAAVEDGVIASLNAQLASLPAAAADSAELDGLVSAAATERDRLDTLTGQSGEVAIPIALSVRIITPAVPALVPASPKGVPVLLAVGALSLILQIGAVLLGALRSGREAKAEDIEPEPELPVEAETETPVSGSVAEMVALMEADLADTPEPVLAVVPPEPASPPQRDDGLQLLAADLALGRARIVLIAGIAEARDAAVVTDTLVNDALSKGLSVCRIDAGSGRPSTVDGLTDLCAEAASFGDVVHKVRGGLAEVPWGRTAVLDRRSIKPLTLVEALADIYEVVIVSTGGIGLNSSLPIFAGLPGRLVLVRQAATPRALSEAVMLDAASIGFDSVESVLVPEPQSAVA